MKFSEALEAMLAGKVVDREGIRDVCDIHLVKGAMDGDLLDAKSPPDTTGVPLALFEPWDKGIVTRHPYLAASCDGAIVVWTPNAIDLLANDWVILD